MRADLLLAIAFPETMHELRRREVMMGLAFVSFGCVVRRFLGLPHVDDGAILLAQIKEHVR